MGNVRNITDDLQKHTGVSVDRCYQCGKCTAGCVLAEDMDYPPSYIMRLLQTNNADNFDKVLRSKAIWLCLNCENCVGRCPMEIDIPGIMDYLRERSLKEGKQNPAAKPIIAFHRSFLDSVKYTGHLYEIGLIADFKTRTLRMTQDLKLAPKMFLKGKLNIFPEMVKGTQNIKRIFSKTKNKTK
jgi:heterodisulfide reductase subunit C2